MSVVAKEAPSWFRALPTQRAAPLVIISPVRNEQATLPETIESLRKQTVQPALWVLVDDGSTDATAAIIREAAAQCDWIRALRRKDRGHRAVGPGVIEAFCDGLAAVDCPYDFIGKLDGDVVLPPTYIERIMQRFDADETLGAASGKTFLRDGDRLIEEFMIDEMVAGQFLVYRRSVFEAIGGFVRQVMWDGIAFHRARMAGFRTASFSDPELRIEELRPMGASEGNVYRGRFRHGCGQWFMGSSLPYVVASGVFRMRERPYVIGGLLMIAGYIKSALSRAARYEDPSFRAGLRSWQHARIAGVFKGHGVR